jgi:3-hydroxybutyryl-CoA dehydrogenase
MKLENVKTIGVLGAGVMGSGISQVAILAGYNVINRDLNDEILARSKDNMINGRFGFKGAVERGKITQQQVEQAISRLKLTTKIEDLKNVDVLIEAIGGGPSGELENKDVKLKVFKEMDGIVKKEAIFASNTSMFTIRDLAVATKRLDKFIGMHFFSPANIMKVVEITWTAETSEETIKTIEGICDKVGKVHVRVKDVPGDKGFIGNRIFSAVRKEAQKIIEEGVVEKPEDIDTVLMGGFNWPVGPIGLGRGARGGWK